MKVNLKRSADFSKYDLVVIPLFRQKDYSFVFKKIKESKKLFEKNKFKGDFNKKISLFSQEFGNYFVFIGLGKKIDDMGFRKLSSSISSYFKDKRFKSILINFLDDRRFNRTNIENFLDYIYLNNYSFDKYKKKKQKGVGKIDICLEKRDKSINKDLFDERYFVSEVVNEIRDIVNEPPDVLNPDSFVDLVKSNKLNNVKIDVYDGKDLEDMELKGLINVGKGSKYSPYFVRMEYKPEKYKRTIAIVGKGITFDSGGLNIKVGNYMSDMKSDMAGAAVSYGVLKIASVLNLSVRIISFLSIAENMPSSTSYKPDDIIVYRNKKSVEIVNTDAEGRLVLADGIIMAAEEKPDLIVEFSTLTGAIITALGDMYAGLFTKNSKFADLIYKSGEESGDFVWKMPLPDDYVESIKSKIADLKNANYSGASSIKAGLFLNEFSSKIPFVHLDIAGTAFINKSTSIIKPTGATGFGIRLMLSFLKKF